MAFCKNCGAELAEDQKFCANCGAVVEEAPAAEPVAEPIAEPVAEPVILDEAPKKAGLNVGMLVWSIIGIVCCCTPLSVAALIFTILAANNTPEDAASKISKAKLFNILSVVLGAVCFIFYFVIVLLAGLLTGLTEAFAFMM